MTALEGQPPLQGLAARRAEIGHGFGVARALPVAARRTIGAWCFLDHAGPARFASGQGMRVGPHPHIGLQTFTWMIEGQVQHHDSLGHAQVVRPGQVNLMTAGRGIAHSEESVDTGEGGALHAAQLWIALPPEERQRAPAFEHHPVLPAVPLGGFTATVLVGQALGELAPPRVHSALVGIDLTAPGAATARVPLQPGFEHGLLVLRGSVRVNGQPLPADTLLFAPRGVAALDLACDAAAQVLLIGGEPYEHDLVVWWNFVGGSHDEVAEAAADWSAGRRFGPVPGTTLAPLAMPALPPGRLVARPAGG